MASEPNPVEHEIQKSGETRRGFLVKLGIGAAALGLVAGSLSSLRGIGGGNSGVQEAIFLTKFAPKVTLITNGAELTASAVLQQKASELPQIQVLTDTVVEEFTGNGRLSAVTVRGRQSDQLTTLNPQGVFVFIGLQPNAELAKGVVALDERGFIITGMGLETSVPGLFAAGDVRAGSTKQAASAVGEGASAALAIREYLKDR